jgi:hypothetical protein
MSIFFISSIAAMARCAFCVSGSARSLGSAVGVTCRDSPNLALEILLVADDLDGSRAEQYGYVNRAIADDALDHEVDAIASRVAQFDHNAIARTKFHVDRASPAVRRRARRGIAGLLPGVRSPRATRAAGDAGGAGPEHRQRPGAQTRSARRRGNSTVGPEHRAAASRPCLDHHDRAKSARRRGTPHASKNSGLTRRLACDTTRASSARSQKTDVDANVVLVSNFIGRGKTSLVFALTRGNTSPTAVEAATHTILSR